MMLLVSPCKRCPCPCSDAVLRSCEEALAGIILHRPPSLWLCRTAGCQGRPGPEAGGGGAGGEGAAARDPRPHMIPVRPSPPPSPHQWFLPSTPPPVWCGGGLLPSPPVVWCGVVVGCFPPPCGVVWFGCGLWWFPPFPPVAWCGLGGSPLHVWICLGCLANPCS